MCGNHLHEYIHVSSCFTIVECILVGGRATPLKNMTSSVGIIIHNIWKIKNVPNHQAVYIIIYPSIAGFSFISLAPIHLSFPNQTLAKPDP